MNETEIIPGPRLDMCRKYSKLPMDISHSKVRWIFWGGIGASVVILWICGYAFARTINRRRRLLKYQRIWENEDPCKAHATELTDSRLVQKYRSRVKITFVICLICTLLTAGLTVCIAFAGLALQFCDGEEMFFLVWSFWPLLALGAVIAEIGVCIYLCKILCRKKDEVPWGTAMGTPILILATVGYWVLRGLHTLLRYWFPCVWSPTDDADLGFPRGRPLDEDEDRSTVMATDAFMDNEDDEEHQYDLESFPRSRPCSPRRVYPGTRSWRGSQNGLIPRCPAPCCRARSLSF
ncbi:hypothetical protein GLAREA_05654 [Glarea lozoyensis ATCC 20868]|uniref:Transmembrane protein n=1 Tax=Glarea lozoyensis (strain ATCC 20868 / MF5171) TaxID=1116229 RepID=S3DWL9_GLAL2|nr:uncharacterized protein GLAREA_05654 [Glarea lozoyensis ATCC 20868]EPE36316.1 hypothetical protein GLAREA_05654 [Glarea lozoyensis ATCC 20868]